MSHGKKSKHKKHNHPSGHEQSVGDEQLNRRPQHVTVTGKVEADLPPNLVDKYDAAGKKEDRWNHKNFAVGIITAILLFVYTTVAAWQGCTSQKMADIAAGQLEADRPWMGATVHVERFQIGEKAVSSISFNNSGKSPAKITGSNLQSGCYKSFPDPEQEYAKGGVHGTSVIVPGGFVTTANRPLIGSESHAIDPTITKAVMASTFNTDACTFYIFGTLEYSDVNRKTQWWTHTCWQYVRPVSAFDIGGFANCPDYNDAH